MLVFFGLFLWIARLTWVNRKLKKQLELRAALTPPEHASAIPAKTGEIDALKARLQVLERIAVDKEHSLAREIEQLRQR